MNTGDSAEAAGRLEAIRSREIDPELRKLRKAGFRLLLERGAPIDILELSRVTELPRARIESLLASNNGRVELGSDGRLMGIAGLTVRPGRHRIEMDGSIRWTWCAIDAIGIVGALGGTASVFSPDAQNGEELQIEFVDGQPRGDQAVFVLDGYDGANLREEWCPNVNFFADIGAARAWATSRGLEGNVVSVQEIAEEATQIWRSVI